MPFGYNASAPTQDADSGWIDTQGRWYAVEYARHSRFAALHVGEVSYDPVGVLESMGWVHVSAWNVYVDPRCRINQPQLDTLYEMLMVMHEDDKPFFIRKTRQHVPDFAEGESDNDDW